MPITEEKIRYVKDSSDFIQLAQSYGLTLEKKGNDYFTQCPWHKEDTASLSINQEKRLYHCFGCGAKGNIVQFVQNMEGLAFPQAVEKVAGQNLALVEVNGYTIKKVNGSNGKPAVHQPTFTREQLLTTLESAYKHMRSKFVTSPAANHYMNVKRGFEHYRDIEVGYCPTDFGRKLPKEEQDKLIQLGIMRNRRDVHLAACVVFPLRNVEGQIAGLYGRRIKAPGTHYYLPGPREGVFGIHNGQNDTVYVTESVIDALSLNEIGVMSVLALHGVNCFTSVHEQWLKAKGIKTVYLMLDGDKPGREAAVKLQGQLKENGYICHKLDLPNDDDPNSFFLAAKKKRGLKELEVLPGFPKKTTTPELKLQKQGDELTATMGNRNYTILGLTGHEPSRLKVTVRVSPESDPGQFYIDSPDLYQASARNRFEDGIVKELGGDSESIHGEIKQLITALEKERMSQAAGMNMEKQYLMEKSEELSTLALLRKKELFAELLADFERLGYVGDEKAKILAFVCSVSRLLKKPLGLLIISRSGAGKSALQEAVCLLVPEENLIQYTRITSQALCYHGENGLKNKVLSIEEVDGAREALYSLRTLQSSQRLSTGATRTDPKTGKLIADGYKAEGPVTIMLSGTNPQMLDPETRSRFIIGTVDESCEQTARIFSQSDRFFDDEDMLSDEEFKALCLKWQNVHRLLKPLQVIDRHIMAHIAYPTELLQYRRERNKYRSLLHTIALIRQYQKKEYIRKCNNKEIRCIDVDLEDVRLANELAYEFFPHSLDELAPHARKLGELIGKLCEERDNPVFTRREIREYTGWTNYAVCQGLEQLVEMEYIAKLDGRNGIQYKYKLLIDPRKETRRSFELTSLEELKKKIEQAKNEKKRGENA